MGMAQQRASEAARQKSQQMMEEYEWLLEVYQYTRAQAIERLNLSERTAQRYDRLLGRPVQAGAPREATAANQRRRVPA